MHHDLTEARWRKSTFSGDAGCVELAPLGNGVVALRDSKNPDAGALFFTPREMDAWIKGAKSGEFDDLAH
jgi:hypothetical protein